MSQQQRPMTEAEATIVYQAATLSAKERELMQHTQAVNQLQAAYAQLRLMVPDKALSNEAEVKAWQEAVAAMNKEFAQAGGKPPDGPDAANDPPPAVDPAPPPNKVTPIKGKRR